jgi:hypothetical protein
VHRYGTFYSRSCHYFASSYEIHELSSYEKSAHQRRKRPFFLTISIRHPESQAPHIPSRPVSIHLFRQPHIMRSILSSHNIGITGIDSNHMTFTNTSPSPFPATPPYPPESHDPCPSHSQPVSIPSIPPHSYQDTATQSRSNLGSLSRFSLVNFYLGRNHVSPAISLPNPPSPSRIQRH